jgi:hypothetical protein
MEIYDNLSVPELKVLVTKFNVIATDETGEPHGVVSVEGLESAVGQLKQGWYEPEEAIASCFKSLIINHPFKNGNKRTALMTMRYFKEPLPTKNQLYHLTMQLASEGGSKIESKEIANFLYGTDYKIENPKITTLPDTPPGRAGWSGSIWDELDEIEEEEPVDKEIGTEESSED